MKIIRIFLPLLASLAVSCGTEEDVAGDQQTRFESYLSRMGWDDYVIQGGAYRYTVPPEEDTPAPTGETIEPGDSVGMWFEGYLFESQPGDLFYTNRREVARRIEGLDTRYWSFDLLRIRLGDGSIINGLAEALRGSRSGDSLYVLLTSDLAFGDKEIGTIPKNQALMYIVKIESVKKQAQ